MLTQEIQTCVWTHCGHQTESDTDSLQTHRPCQRKLDEIHSKYHHGPVHMDKQTDRKTVRQSGSQAVRQSGGQTDRHKNTHAHTHIRKTVVCCYIYTEYMFFLL